MLTRETFMDAHRRAVLDITAKNSDRKGQETVSDTVKNKKRDKKQRSR